MPLKSVYKEIQRLYTNIYVSFENLLFHTDRERPIQRNDTN